MMVSRMPNAQQGVALVQVLITTAIMMLLMIYFLTAAKSQIDHAKAMQDKTQAYLSHYSTNSAVLFRLLTSNPNDLLDEGWNFYGVPFEANNDALVEVQDLNGLISLATVSGPELLQALLAEDINPTQASLIASSMADWIDLDDFERPGGAESEYYAGRGQQIGNGPIQTFTELPFIRNMTYEAELVLMKYTTVHPTQFFNPMVAPQKVLSAYLSDSGMAESLVSMRGSSMYSKDFIENETGLTAEDGLDYIQGPNYRITINSKVGNSYYGKVLEYGLYPYERDPVRVLSRLPLQQFE